ncbi:MAG: hypothetical protein JXB38_03000 [Anaerolineales bacterium]|nr:hypothetical protein [Anaerolineales bacterium]
MKSRPILFCILILTLLALLGCAPPAESTPEVTPQTNGDGLTITAVELADEAGAERIDYRGNCPISFQFDGTIHSQGAGDFSYQLRADSNDPDYEFALPNPQTVDNPTDGEYELQVIDSLEISASVDGWVYLYVSDPMEYSSNNVDLVVVCE